MTRARPLLLASVLATPLAAVAVAGCGGSSDDNNAQASASSSSSGGGQALHLTADPNGAIAFNTMSLSAKAGKVTLSMKNPSSSGEEHGIAIEGNCVDEDGPVVEPGQTSTVTATLKPGTYKYYCPFDSHEEEGMTGKLTVR